MNIDQITANYIFNYKYQHAHKPVSWKADSLWLDDGTRMLLFKLIRIFPVCFNDKQNLPSERYGYMITQDDLSRNLVFFGKLTCNIFIGVKYEDN